MQKIYLPLIALFFSTNVFGQKTEFRISLNSGLFAFSGKSAESTSFINYSNTSNSGYTNNPYGSGAALSYGLSADLKRVLRKNVILGVDLGYENLRSKILIDGISGYTGTSTYQYSANGKTLLNYHFLNLYAYAGYRIKANKISFDIIGGIELGYCLNTKEKGNATASNGTKYTTSVDRKTINMDVRPRIQLSANYHKAGVYIGYSHGLANYKSGYIGGTNECYARMFRFGVTYLVK